MNRGVMLLLCLLAAPFMGRAADHPVIVWEGQTMGSTYTIKIVDATLTNQQLEALKKEVDQRLKEVNRQISHYQPDSEISQFNRALAKTPFKVSSEFARLVRITLDLNKRSNGAFDPTLGPVINLWGFGEKTELRKVPSAADLNHALVLTGVGHISINDKDELIKDIPGVHLNLSAIGKGFGVDEIAGVLRSHGLTNFYVSISGEVFTLGHNPKGEKWHVGISAPVSDWRAGDPLAGIVQLSGQAISTSGDFQKFFFDAQGHRLCHIFDPRTGWPVQHNLGGVSVVAKDCATADCLSTTLFVLGPEKGLTFIETYTNAAALFVVREPNGTFKQIPSSRFPAMTAYKP